MTAMHGSLGLIFPGIPMLLFMLLSACFSTDAAPPPSGDLVWRNGTFALKLGDEPCPFEELDAALIERGVPPALAYRELQRNGRWSMPGCWAKDMGGDVITMDTAGGEGFVPIDWFKLDGGV